MENKNILLILLFSCAILLIFGGVLVMQNFKKCPECKCEQLITSSTCSANITQADSAKISEKNNINSSQTLATSTSTSSVVTKGCGDNVCEIGEDITCKTDCPIKGISGFSTTVYPVEHSIDENGYLKFKIKNANNFPVEIRHIGWSQYALSDKTIIMPNETSDWFDHSTYDYIYKATPAELKKGQYYIVMGLNYSPVTNRDTLIQTEGTLAGIINTSSLSPDLISNPNLSIPSN
jgi:hypothetical protein